jgi:hypothetical protein
MFLSLLYNSPGQSLRIHGFSIVRKNRAENKNNKGKMISACSKKLTANEFPIYSLAVNFIAIARNW